VIFLGVKAHGLTQLAPQLKPLIGDATTVVSTQNGIPWWYCHLERVDPGGVIAASIDAAARGGFAGLSGYRDCGAGRDPAYRR